MDVDQAGMPSNGLIGAKSSIFRAIIYTRSMRNEGILVFSSAMGGPVLQEARLSFISSDEIFSYWLQRGSDHARHRTAQAFI